MWILLSFGWSPLNGIKRATIITQVDKFISNLITSCVSEFGEIIEAKSEPKKGCPKLYLQTPDQINIPYNIYFPNSSNDFWKIDFGMPSDKNKIYKSLDDVNISSIVEHIVTIINNRRAELAAIKVANAINKNLPDRTISIRVTDIGGLIMYISKPITEKQAYHMIKAAIECDIIK